MIVKRDNKYFVYGDNGMILIITRSRGIAQNVYNTRMAG